MRPFCYLPCVLLSCFRIKRKPKSNSMKLILVSQPPYPPVSNTRAHLRLTISGICFLCVRIIQYKAHRMVSSREADSKVL